MAWSSPLDVADYSRLQTPDCKVAKNAISKAAKALRGLFENNEERIDLLVRHGLLHDKNTKSVTKELQKNVGEDPKLFWVLVREISTFEDGAEAVKKLQGMRTSSH